MWYHNGSTLPFQPNFVSCHALLPDGIYWPRLKYRFHLVVRCAILHADETIRLYDVSIDLRIGWFQLCLLAQDCSRHSASSSDHRSEKLAETRPFGCLEPPNCSLLLVTVSRCTAGAPSSVGSGEQRFQLDMPCASRYPRRICWVTVYFVFCLSVNASFFRISLSDLCRRLLARLTSATKFMYFENGYDESSIRGAPLRTVALHEINVRH